MSHTKKMKKKKRAIDPREQKSIDALSKDLPLPPVITPKTSRYTIATLKESFSSFLDLIEKTSDPVDKSNLVAKAKEFLSRIPEREEDVETFSNLVRETLPSLTFCFFEHFYSSVKRDVVKLAVQCANRDSASKRWARMMADPSLQSSLANIKTPATSEFEILRLFLCILFGYWGDLDELPKLDAANGTRRFAFASFGFMVYMIDKEYPHQGKEFSYPINDAEDAKDVIKGVREWLASVFGENEKEEEGALFEKVRSKILSQVEFGAKKGFFDGRPAEVKIRLAGPGAFVLQIARPRV